jgi:hypothetical protein
VYIRGQLCARERGCLLEVLLEECVPSQVQAENIQQAEALVRISNKLEGLDTDLKDTQQLIGALHGEIRPSTPKTI